MSVYILLAVPAVIALIFIGMYNGLVAKRNQVRNVAASVGALLQKRYDLIPNLVETVRGSMTHERDLLLRVTELRSRALSQSGTQPGSRDVASNDELGGAVRQVLALAEGYPALQASANFLQLQAALNEVEEQISAARRAFNTSVTDLNNAIEMFPTSIVAGMMGLTRRNWFQIEEDARQNPDVAGRLNT